MGNDYGTTPYTIPNVPKCDYPGCNSLRTHVSRCTMRNCPEGSTYRKTCDDHMHLLCAPELVW